MGVVRSQSWRDRDIFSYVFQCNVIGSTLKFGQSWLGRAPSAHPPFCFAEGQRQRPKRDRHIWPLVSTSPPTTITLHNYMPSNAMPLNYLADFPLLTQPSTPTKSALRAISQVMGVIRPNTLTFVHADIPHACKQCRALAGSGTSGHNG